MNLIYVGKIVNTHGIKGEIRLLSVFEKKDLIFKKDFAVYIGDNNEKLIINSYRHHKKFDMLTFKGIDNINDVIKYKGKKMYIDKADLHLKKDEYLLEDLIGMSIICDKTTFGVVNDIYEVPQGNLLYITFEKNYYIPYNNYYIKDVDVQKKEIYVENIKGLIL